MTESKPKPTTKVWDRQCTYVIKHDMYGRKRTRKSERCKALTGHNYFFCARHQAGRQEYE